MFSAYASNRETGNCMFQRKYITFSRWYSSETRTNSCVVFKKTKPKDHRQKILFIDASSEFKSSRAQNELLPEHVKNIHRWYADYQNVEGICRVVSMDEIRENDYNLNIPRYVEPVIEEEAITVDQAIANLKHSLEAAYAAEDRLMMLLKQNGLYK